MTANSKKRTENNKESHFWRQSRLPAKNAAEGSEKHFGTERQRDERNCGERNTGTQKNTKTPQKLNSAGIPAFLPAQDYKSCETGIISSRI